MYTLAPPLATCWNFVDLFFFRLATLLPNVKRLIRELTANFFDLCVPACLLLVAVVAVVVADVALRAAAAGAFIGMRALLASLLLPLLHLPLLVCCFYCQRSRGSALGRPNLNSMWSLLLLLEI